MSNIPAIAGPQLIKLLVKDGWQIDRKANHGARLHKKITDRVIHPHQIKIASQRNAKRDPETNTNQQTLSSKTHRKIRPEMM